MKLIYAISAALLLVPLATAQAPAPLLLTQQAPGGQPTYQTNPPFATLPTTAHHEANFDTETQQANTLFTTGHPLDALPLYEDLSRQDPTVPLFAERHAATLLAKWGSSAKDPNQQLSAFLQAMNELHRAQRLGDNSAQLRGLLTVAEKTPMGAILTGVSLTVGYTYQGTPAAQAIMRQAEQAFAAQKLDEAARLYASAATQDPAYYTAALFAGDAYFRLKDNANAGLWYAKAIAIDPDRETAYRYWADALYRAGDPAAAKIQIVKAYIAEPYSVATWNELRQWAAATKTPLTVPQVRRPDFYLLNGKLDFDPKIIPENGNGHASWLVYQHIRVAHGAHGLVQNMPPAGGTMVNGELSPSGYVHTLAEETEALENAMLADIDHKLAAGTVTVDKLESSIKILLQLRKDNMLECFILLNASDLGLRRDYPKYRAGHRDHLTAYVDKYLLTPSTSPTP